jgi:hypothetical protein
MNTDRKNARIARIPRNQGLRRIPEIATKDRRDHKKNVKERWAHFFPVSIFAGRSDVVSSTATDLLAREIIAFLNSEGKCFGDWTRQQDGTRSPPVLDLNATSAKTAKEYRHERSQRSQKKFLPRIARMARIIQAERWGQKNLFRSFNRMDADEH